MGLPVWPATALPRCRPGASLRHAANTVTAQRHHIAGRRACAEIDRDPIGKVVVRSRADARAERQVRAPRLMAELRAAYLEREIRARGRQSIARGRVAMKKCAR